MSLLDTFANRCFSACFKAYDREVEARSLELHSLKGNVIGLITLLSEQMLTFPNIVEDISCWRNNESGVLSDYSRVTYDSTLKYLRSWVSSHDRVFLLYWEFQDDSEMVFIGHIGIIDLGNGVCSLENMRRGRVSSLNCKAFMFLAECRIINLLQLLGFSEVRLETMSYNLPLLALHFEVGFAISSKHKIDSSIKKLYKRGLPLPEAEYCKYSVVNMVKLLN